MIYGVIKASIFFLGKDEAFEVSYIISFESSTLAMIADLDVEGAVKH